MATNLAIDPGLLDRALKIGGERTKKATVTRALEEYIVEGIKTNIPFHKRLLRYEPFVQGRYDTRLVEKLLAET